MIAWLRIAIQSAIARKGSIVIMVLSTTISVAILLGVFKIRDDTKTSFSNAISGVDLVPVSYTHLTLPTILRV